MSLTRTIETLGVLADENRIRLCALLSTRELNVTDLVRVTGLAQSRVSTHLRRLRNAGLVRDRRDGTHCFYSLASEDLHPAVASVLGEANASEDPTLVGDRERLDELDREQRGGRRDVYSPGRTWQSLAVGIAALLDLGDVLDVGCGEGAVASMIAPYCRSLHCVDTSPRAIELAKERLRHDDVRAEPRGGVAMHVADAQALPFADESFDTVLLFHTLTYIEEPERALREGERVLRAKGRLVVLCLDAHRHDAIAARHGARHAGFTPQRVRSLLETAELSVRTSKVASREAKKPHLRVVLAIGEKKPRTPAPGP